MLLASVTRDTPTILTLTETGECLGIWLEKYHNFITHWKKMLTKGTGSLQALYGISVLLSGHH